MSEIPDAFVATAERIVLEAGKLATSVFRRATILQHKPGGDLVTQADLAVERFVLSELAAAFPDHGVLSEEAGERLGNGEYVWVLDPIDGSRHFSQGLPLYSVSLALRRADELVVGVVYDPETRELFSASPSCGARLNGTPIRCSPRVALSESTVCLEIPRGSAPPDVLEDALGALPVLMRHASRVRVIGVSALGLCYCAAGAFDAYVNLSRTSKVWDLAAGECILKAAGGTISRLPNAWILGGPAPLHDELCRVLKPMNVGPANGSA